MCVCVCVCATLQPSCSYLISILFVNISFNFNRKNRQRKTCEAFSCSQPIKHLPLYTQAQCSDTLKIIRINLDQRYTAIGCLFLCQFYEIFCIFYVLLIFFEFCILRFFFVLIWRVQIPHSMLPKLTPNCCFLHYFIHYFTLFYFTLFRGIFLLYFHTVFYIYRYVYIYVNKRPLLQCTHGLFIVKEKFGLTLASHSGPQWALPLMLLANQVIVDPYTS